ncbi:MAG TPA: ABC transporter substrate binding protein [Calditrichia bacterium]|nr:ABC transporter substrate binding protein [Calditrichia bacterium]
MAVFLHSLSQKSRTVKWTGFRRIAILLMAIAGMASANPGKRVLYISSNHPSHPTFSQQVEGIKEVFRDRTIALDIEFMDSKRIPDPGNLESFRARLSYKMSVTLPYDLVIVADDNALIFGLSEQHKIFKGLPIVFLGINNQYLATAQDANPQVTGVVEAISMRENLALMTRIQNRARKIIALSDNTPSGRADLETFYSLREEFPNYRFEDINLSEMPLEDYLKSLHKIKKTDAVILLAAYLTNEGQSMSFEESLGLILDPTSPPVFHPYQHGVGQGLLGGMVISHVEQGRVAAELATEILAGRPVSDIRVVSTSPNQYMFDYKRLAHFKIDLDKLPEDYLLINPPSSFYERHRNLIWSIILAFFTLTGLLILSVFNILRRKETERNLRESEMLLKKSQEIAHVGNWMRDHKSGTDFWSEEMYRILRLDPSQKPPHPDDFNKMIHPADQEVLGDYFKKSVEENEPFEKTYRIYRADGSLATVMVRGEHIVEDREVRSFGIMHDITELKQSEAERDRLVAAIHQAAEVVFVTGIDGVIQYVNPAFERVTGYSRQEILGQKPNILKSGEHDQKFYQGMWHSLQNLGTWQGRIHNRQKNGRIFIADATFSPVLNDSGEVINYVAVMRDISKEVNLENRLKQAYKMEAIGTLAGGIAHDFNNILTPLIGYGELLREVIEPESVGSKFLEEMQRASLRLKDLVKQILAFSRQSEQKVQPIKLNPLVKEALRLVRSMIPATIEIQADLNREVGLVNANPTQIHQMVMNLVTNAFHAMQDTGGVLTVELSEREIGDGCEHYVDVAPGNYTCLRVRDTGVGIEKEHLDKIFDPYFTTKAEGRGTGLGLSVVHGIVKGYGGDIHIDTEPGKGTTICVLLPVSEAESLPEEAEKGPEEIPGGRERIMLVDDDPSIVRMLSRMLTQLGYQVSAFTSSPEALAGFENEPAHYQLILTDMTMPKMTGIQLAEKVRELNPMVPVVICTGYSDQIDEETWQSRDIQGFIMKPIFHRDVAETVRRALDKVAEKQPEVASGEGR